PGAVAWRRTADGLVGLHAQTLLAAGCGTGVVVGVAARRAVGNVYRLAHARLHVARAADAVVCRRTRDGLVGLDALTLLAAGSRTGIVVGIVARRAVGDVRGFAIAGNLIAGVVGAIIVVIADRGAKRDGAVLRPSRRQQAIVARGVRA